MKIIDILQKNPFFSGLEKNEIVKLTERSRKKTVEKNTFILKENDRSNEMYLLIEGKVNVMVNNLKGKEMILATLHQGDIFGELSIIDDDPRSANIVAAEKCELIVISKPDFYELLNQSPKFAIQVIKYLCHRLRLTNRTAESFALLTTYERLKNYFESISQPEEGKDWVITTHETQEVIASRIGCTREMVSKILKKLKKDHQCLSYKHNKITIHKMLPLKL